MNMCLLEVAMCEKCRNSHFQLEGGVKVAGNCCCLLLHRVHQQLYAKVLSQFFSLLWQYISKKTGKDSAETFVHNISNSFYIPLYFSKGLCFGFLTVETTSST